MKKKATMIGLITIIFLIGLYYFIDNRKKVDSTEQPFHAVLYKDCTWVRRQFPISGISFYEEKCPLSTAELSTYFESKDGKIMSTNASIINGQPYVVMEILNKDPSHTPLQVMQQQWFDKLNSKQKTDCSIQDANQIQSKYSGEAPYNVDHKIRYNISVKPEVKKSIMDKFNGIPTDSAYDYLCGNTVGSLFDASSPYFEFDNRSPSKYLFVHLSWNDEGPNIDLNTIRF